MIKLVLIDLDGTLLPMDQEEFLNAIGNALTKRANKWGHDGKELINTMWQGTYAMVANTGDRPNEELFWEVLTKKYSKEFANTKEFNDFYMNEFQEVKNSCGYNELASKLISILKNKNVKIVVATNPVFPKSATYSRIEWAGLLVKDFDYVTTYEDNYYCKPNLKYYSELLNRFNVEASETIMIGNDVEEDMICSNLGIDTFLLTDCLINKKNKDISTYKHGDFSKLIEYLNNLL